MTPDNFLKLFFPTDLLPFQEPKDNNQKINLMLNVLNNKENSSSSSFLDGSVPRKLICHNPNENEQLNLFNKKQSSTLQSFPQPQPIRPQSSQNLYVMYPNYSSHSMKQNSEQNLIFPNKHSAFNLPNTSKSDQKSSQDDDKKIKDEAMSDENSEKQDIQIKNEGVEDQGDIYRVISQHINQKKTFYKDKKNQVPSGKLPQTSSLGVKQEENGIQDDLQHNLILQFIQQMQSLNHPLQPIKPENTKRESIEQPPLPPKNDIKLEEFEEKKSQIEEEKTKEPEDDDTRDPENPEDQCKIYEKLIQKYQKQIKTFYVEPENENKKNFSGIFREYCANQIREIMGGIKRYSRVHKQNKRQNQPMSAFLPVCATQEQVQEIHRELPIEDRLRLQPIYKYLMSLTNEEYLEVDKQLLSAKFEHESGNCWHSKKGWKQTCQWIKQGDKVVQDLYLMMFKGFMKDEEQFLLFKYHYICHSDRKSNQMIKYMMGDQISLDYDNLIQGNF